MRKLRNAVTIVTLLILIILPTALAQDAPNDGRYMVKFKEFRGASEAVRAAGGQPVLSLEPQRVIAAYLPEQALRGLQNNPNVEYIEVDPRRFLMADTKPYGITMVQADDAFFDNNNSSGAQVCIIDSGYYRAHTDLQDTNVSGTNDSGTGLWYEDSCGHGTHVAGTVAALKNGTGVLGVNSNGSLNIWVEKVFNGTNCAWTYSSSLVEALNRCRNNAGGRKLVVSMSLGGSFSSTTENNAFQNAYNAGVLSIAAAGNDGSTRKSYPASYGSVVSVAAVDSTGAVASFSQKNDAVELAAPGVGVLSTTPFKASTITTGGVTYLGANIDGSARTDRSGTAVNGGLCGSAGSWSGRVVLCQRGTYSFAEKVAAVQNGGGVAAVIYNNVSGGFAGTLNGTSTIPAISISMEDGNAILSGTLGTATVANSTGTGDGYEYYDGTSMATPHVSGVAALVWSRALDKTNAQVRDALQKTAEDRGSAGKDNSYGYGIVKAKAAFCYLNPSDTACGGGGTPNNPPSANFGFTTSNLTANFTDSSSDSDGSVTGWSWAFGDGNTSTAQNPSHTYSAAGTYTVSLTVTDDDGATASTSKSVTVASTPPSGITLSATGYKVKGIKTTDLTWSGATSTSVDVFRSGTKVATTANDGAHTDNTGQKGGGSYTYKVCEAGTSTCSNEVTVSY